MLCLLLDLLGDFIYSTYLLTSDLVTFYQDFTSQEMKYFIEAKHKFIVKEQEVNRLK